MGRGTCSSRQHGESWARVQFRTEAKQMVLGGQRCIKLGTRVRTPDLLPGIGVAWNLPEPLSKPGSALGFKSARRLR